MGNNSELQIIKKYSSFKKCIDLYIFFFKTYIFLSIFQYNLCNNSRFTYPKSITLLNGNIFIIHKTGIEIYDSSLTNSLHIIRTFNEEEQISDPTKLGKVSITRFNQNDNGLIICIIINKIFIFNYKGEELFVENDSEIIAIFNGNYYDLTAIKRNGEKYIYQVGFINSNKANLFYFEYDKEKNINQKIGETTPFNYIDLNKKDQECSFINKGITCEVMVNSNNEENLVCFFNIHNSTQILSLASIDLNNYEVSNIGFNSLAITDIKGLKSVVTQDKKKSLICMNFASSASKCTIYSYFDNSFYEFNSYEVSCKDGFYAINLEYMRETEQYILSCTDNSGQISAAIFDKEFKHLNTFIVIRGSQVISSSIIYSYELGTYIAISDIDYSGEDKTVVELSAEVKPSIVAEKIEELIPLTSLVIPTISTTMKFTETIPKIKTTLPQIITTLPKIITTLPKIITTIPKIITTIPKTKTTQPIQTTPSFVCPLEKCKECNQESASKKLCLECNKSKQYYEISPLINYNPNFKGNLLFNHYKECYNSSTKPPNFYLNKTTEYYEPCYKSCASCEFNGDGNQNNCTTCDVDYMKDPRNPNSTNCVPLCTYFYYYTSYGQFKCSSTPQCPEESSLLIRFEKKCVESCFTEKKYKYQYNGECLEQCPEDTDKDESAHLCRVKNYESCTKSISEFELYNFLKEGGVEKIAKNYAREFNYTQKHISLFTNEVYSIMLYKDKECITELNLPMPEIDFGECYKKVQEVNKINSDLVVAIIDKYSDKKSNPITSYAFYNPENGDKLDAENACKEEVIIVKENIKSLLNDSVREIDSILFLAGQNIDVFNKSCEFYTDICYHFESPCNKDVALRDRLLIYYPNITLCDSGCTNAGVNLTSMTAICVCKYKELTEDDTDEVGNLYKEAMKEVYDILNQINIAVMGCYKDLFDPKYFLTNLGGFIILTMIMVQIIALIIYYYSSSFLMKKYVYDITESYLLYLNRSPLFNNKVMKFKFNNNQSDDDNANLDRNKKKKNKSKNNNFPPRKVPTNKNSNKDIYRIHNNTDKRRNEKVKKKKIHEILDEKLSYEDMKKIKKGNANNSGNNSKAKLHLKNINYLEKGEYSNQSNKSPYFKREKTRLFVAQNPIFEKYLSIELCDMHFHEVIKNDKRLFFDYFCDKLKHKQVFLELFCVKDPLKPVAIKLLLLVLDLEICFVVNAMFINEDYVSYLFHSKKEETFISFIPRSVDRCLYTIFAKVCVNYFIGCLFVEERKIKNIFRREKNDLPNLKYQISILMKEIKIMYNIFIIIAGLFSIFSWYYISCFNNIYPHMRMEWIKSSFLIIILIYVLSILVILVETILRFISFEFKSEKLYRASLWIG